MQRVPSYLDFANGRLASLSAEVGTTDATPTTILEITPEAYARGYLKVAINASSADGQKGLIGEKIFHWRCVAGDLTLVNAIDIVATDRENLTTADFDLDVSDDILKVKVTGEAATNMNWSLFYSFDSITTTELP